MNFFDCDRQRSYFERTNQRLQKKIISDGEHQAIEKDRRTQVELGETSTRDERNASPRSKSISCDGYPRSVSK